MPAAAVIPAPIAYVKIAAVKKLVVGFLAWCTEPAAYGGECLFRVPAILRGKFSWEQSRDNSPIVYFEKIRVFKAG